MGNNEFEMWSRSSTKLLFEKAFEQAHRDAIESEPSKGQRDYEMQLRLLESQKRQKKKRNGSDMHSRR